MESKFKDKKIQCVDCNREFTWTAGEQEYYDDRNFSQPKRCKPCRAQKKQTYDKNESSVRR